MSRGYTPPPVTPDLQTWAQKVVTYLRSTASRLQFKTADASASEDAVILWDAVEGYPVVSKGGEYRQIVLADGFAMAALDTDLTAAAANTAYQVPLALDFGDGITVSGGDLVFGEGGVYVLSFSAQISSSSSSTVTFHFWPRVNGNDYVDSAIVATLHSNGSTTVVSRSMSFVFSAGDTLRVMWAVNSTAGSLKAHPATAYAPNAPAVTLAATRTRA